MRKLYTTPEYKKKHKRRLEKIDRHIQNKKKPVKKIRRKETKSKKESFPVLYAPSDLRLIENTEECLIFFRKLRGKEYLTEIKATYRNSHARFIDMSLETVEQIDYTAISVLTSISDDMKDKKIILRTNFPSYPISRQFLIESGFLDHMVDASGRKFPKAEKSEMIFFEKGGKFLTENDQRNISSLVQKVITHLNGTPDAHLQIKTIIKEICGNSIEWSGDDHKFWLFGIKYEQDKVLFTLTDIGRGVLDTLYIKHFKKITNFVFLTASVDILKGAFVQKYGSSSREINRNKGLPSIKATSDSGLIENLKLITNNVILHFNNDSLSRSVENNKSFDGTFYQWELTKDCINKMMLQ